MKSRMKFGKKIVSVVLSLVMAAGLIAVSGGVEAKAADESPESKLKYEIITGTDTVRVKEFNGPAANSTDDAVDVTIPSTVVIDGKNYSVVEIGETAFRQRKVRKVVIPSSVTTICFSAFTSCSSLEEIDIPDSVTVMGVEIFLGCSAL